MGRSARAKEIARIEGPGPPDEPEKRGHLTGLRSGFLARFPQNGCDTRHIRPAPVGAACVMNNTLPETPGPLLPDVTGITSKRNGSESHFIRLTPGRLDVYGLRAERKWCD